MRGDAAVYARLEELGITYRYYEHPPAPTIEIAIEYWKDITETSHCKNLFFRNHKGNRHYLVIFDHRRVLPIHDLEKRLLQGKLSFASPARMMQYLGLTPGSVSPFGLIHDTGHQVVIFLDQQLSNLPYISFHPNDNTASLVIAFDDFIKYLDASGNHFELLALYDS